MFTKILVANRGEIALRVIRACKEMGIATVAVHSEADEESLHVKFADEAVCIGPPPPAQSYLNYNAVISAAEISGADAVHPGYGFLAENSEFAEICESSNISWIGPSPDIIDRMGNKSAAKDLMMQAGIPVIPGSNEPIGAEQDALGAAESIGYPIMIKAAAGGGGKGMRIAESPDALVNNLLIARAEAEGSFGDPSLYLEKYIDAPRHIEVQLLGDKYGSIVHFGERDCSIQRRHQKLLEESPCVALRDDLREAIYASAIKGAQSIGYHSAGTMEFLVEGDQFFFMEMNTRIQVEHPVSEMVTGRDLIKEQISVAAGEHLSFEQKDIISSGHALECRINAEDPEQSFLPCPGRISFFHLPGGPGVRVDSHVYQGYEITSFYDSMIAKIICHGLNREEAISKMNRALEECVIEGVKSTLGFQRTILRDKRFIEGDISTRFLETHHSS